MLYTHELKISRMGRKNSYLLDISKNMEKIDIRISDI